MLIVEAKLKEVFADSKGGTKYQFEYFRSGLGIPKNVDTKILSTICRWHTVHHDAKIVPG